MKNRFKAATNDELEDLSKVKMTKNTIQSTRWAMKNFQDWFFGYNDRNPDNQCPDEILLPSYSVDTLRKWLCIYVADKKEEKVSKILSGVVDMFSVESEPVVPPKPPVYAVPPTLPSTVNHPPSVAQPMAGSHYYNCTVNMYEMPKQCYSLAQTLPHFVFI